jgi:signal peptidase II
LAWRRTASATQLIERTTRVIVMATFVIAALLVPIVDQAVKRFVRGRVAARPVSLGVVGELRVVQTRIWMRRGLRPASLRAMWGVWAAAAAASLAMSAVVPDAAWTFGLLVGGALSHALETTLRGTVCDYVCLRFWPAFNLADVALTVGMLGIAFELVTAVR